MRWIWIDAFVAFSSGESASAVKNVTLAEDILHDHFPGWPVFPPSLMVEGMAQTAGILVGECRDFRDNVVLAKLQHVELARYAGPGQQIRYDASLVTIDDRAAATTGVVSIDGESSGTVDLIFSHVRGENQVGLPSHNFVFTDQFMYLVEQFRGAGGGLSGADRHADGNKPAGVVGP